MARDLLAQDSVQATLDRIVVHAAELVAGCEHAGIMLLHRGNQVETAATTSDLVDRADQIQAELGEGPCFDAAFRRHRTYRIADLEAVVTRWPRYAPRARELGIDSMMGFLLYTDEDDLGALDLYSSAPNAFSEHSELAGWLLASHAAVAFAGARTNNQLHTALDTRQDIGKALGMIMERCSLTEQRAFQLLTKVSQNNNIKLRDAAREINNGAAFPPR